MLNLFNLKKQSSPVFIFGSGRSGTTLLLKILNSVDGVYIWGEHGWFLRDIARSYFINFDSAFLSSHLSLEKNSLSQATKAIKNPKIFAPWVNWFSKKDIQKSYANFIESIFNPKNNSKIWGFKEISYGIDDRVLEFLLELFPQAKFIFVVRSPLQVITGQLFNFDNGDRSSLQKRTNAWVSQNKYFFEFYQKNRANCHIVKFEELIDKKSKCLENVFNFLHLSLSQNQYSILDIKEGRGETQRKEITREEEKQIKKFTNDVAFNFGYGDLKEAIGIKCDSPKFIYFPIPKSGCTSLKLAIADLLSMEKLSDPMQVHHVKFNWAGNLKKGELQEYFKFAFVRNPWDRVVSFYNDKIGENENVQKTDFEKGILKTLIKLYGYAFYAGMPFEEFVEKIVSSPDERAEQHFRSQYTFTTDFYGKLLPDFVGKFENFKKDFEFVSQNLDEKLGEFHENKNEHKPYQEYYTEKTRDLIAKRYAKDIELFGYTFE